MKRFIWLLLLVSPAWGQALPFPGPGTFVNSGGAPIGVPTSIGTIGTGAVNVSSQTLTTTANIVSGNAVFICVGSNSPNTITVNSISDGTNTYTVAKQQTISANTNLEIWYKGNAAAVSSGATITVTFSGTTGTSSGIIILAAQDSGVVASPLDKVAGNFGTTATSVSATTASLVTANELAIGCSYQIVAQTYSGASGFTNLNTVATSGGNGSGWMDYQKLSSATAVTYAPTWASGSLRIGAAIGTFKGN